MLRAFTLIELLVVIAIIAILAAILFPVFAQAKAAAKATASLSNIKQIDLGLQMYMNDYDDTVVLSGTWNGPNDPFTISPNTLTTWGWLLNPYLKSGPLTQDPLAPPNGQVITGASDTTNDLFFTQYGMNYVYLTPEYFPTTGNPYQQPVTSSTISQPAATVFATSKYSYSETQLANNGYFYYDTVASPALWTTVEVPDCITAFNAGLNCFNNWGANDGYLNDSAIVGLTSSIAGSNTGGVAIRTPGGDAVTAFMDGHVKSLTASQLAAGTNWTPTIQASSVITVDPTKYIWDLQ
jgi:prepilin-type N-terminal cleavage/methylation domain-containing protein